MLPIWTPTSVQSNLNACSQILILATILLGHLRL